MKGTFDTFTDIEHLYVKYERTGNILRVYEEKIDEYMEFLEGEGECSISKYVVAQYDTLRSLLEIAIDHQREATAELRQIIDSYYQQRREESQKQTASKM